MAIILEASRADHARAGFGERASKDATSGDASIPHVGRDVGVRLPWRHLMTRMQVRAGRSVEQDADGNQAASREQPGWLKEARDNGGLTREGGGDDALGT